MPMTTQDVRSRLQTITCESDILKMATENSTHDIERRFTLMDGVVGQRHYSFKSAIFPSKRLLGGRNV